MDKKISFIGMGKLGLPFAGCLAAEGYDVIGVDLQEQVVADINAGRAPFFEPGLAELMADIGGNRLQATTDLHQAVVGSDITIILVATPSNPDGSFSNNHVLTALTQAADAFKESGNDYHIFVVSSTVMPGSCDDEFLPLLEKHTGRRVGEGFDLCYNPDFVALGNVIKDFQNPEMVVIGESSPAAGNQIAEIHHTMCKSSPPISQMTLINAEIAKVTLNTYVTTKISFANMLANLCEKIPGANVDDITSSIGHDRRISPYYFKGGMGFGGACFPRDTWAFIQLAYEYDQDPALIQAVEGINQYQDDHLSEIIQDALDAVSGSIVGILGTAFKQDTPVIIASPAIRLIHLLLKSDAAVIAWDEYALDATRDEFGDQIQYADDAAKCLHEAQVAVLTIRSKPLIDSISQFAPEHELVIIDPWRCLDESLLHNQIRVISLGVGVPE